MLSYGTLGNIALYPKTQHKPLTSRTEVLTPQLGPPSAVAECR
jgi:hypothetical protein